MIAARRAVCRVNLSYLLAVTAVALAALGLRLYGLNWDRGADLHPDELFVAKIVLIDRIRLDWPISPAQLLDPASSGLNPRSADPRTGAFREFAYGALPLLVTDAVGWVLGHFSHVNWNGIDHAYLVGRALSAILSALTVLPVAAIGTVMAGRTVGILAALFAALAPMSIQLGHFFTTDSWLTFFVALALLACVHAAQRGHVGDFALAGFAFGLAMATKGSVLSLLVPVAATAIHAQRRLAHAEPREVMREIFARGGAAAAAALAAFALFEPFALLRPDVYVQSLRTQADIVSGTFDVPFTRVYVGTAPLLYQIENFVLWGYGPAAGILALAGLVLIGRLARRGASPAATIMMSWLIAYGAVISLSEVKFLRYLEPLAPVFAIAAAYTLVNLRDWLVTRSYGRAAVVAVPAALLAAGFWTAGFTSIYAHEHPRLLASNWIFANLAPGSSLTAEYWDDALPRGRGFAFSPTTFGYRTTTLDLYRDQPPEEASDAIFAALAQADVVVQSSRRVEAAILAAPWRYPVQGRYFGLLHDGVLGFTDVTSFQRPPGIGPVSIDDRHADESFINYDHPLVDLYKKSRGLSRETYDLAMSWAMQRPWFPQRAPPEPTLLLDVPVGDNPAVADGRWSAALTQSTPTAIVAWVALLAALLAVGLPVAGALLSPFPDRGWGLARTLGLAVAAYPVWLGASLEVIEFRAIWVVAALLAVGVGGWFVLWRRGGLRRGRKEPRGHRLWRHAELAFWLPFLLFLAFRLITPDGWHPFWGGEKPMEFAQINAIERSAYFPPYDPWYADGYLNYYYYGFYLVAFLFKATGIPAEIGFNLALPTCMGLLASGGFSAGAALASRLGRSTRLTIGGGWTAAIGLSVLGNLSAAGGLLESAESGLDPFIRWTWNGSRAIDNAITEFPFFTGLYADLHAHVVALPLTVSVIAVCFALVSESPESRGLEAAAFRRRFGGRTFMLALLLGTISVTNAWDAPVYGALAVSSLFMATGGITPWTKRLALLATGTVATVGGAWLLFLPFHDHFVALFGTIAPVNDPTELRQFLGHFGGLVAICTFGLTALLLQAQAISIGGLSRGLLAALGGLLITATVVSVMNGRTRATEIALLAMLAGPPLAAGWQLSSTDRSPARLVGRGLCVAAVVVGAIGVRGGREVFALMLALGLSAAAGWVVLRRPAPRFVCLLMAAACFTAAGPEVIVVADDLIGTSAYRMNTIFKFYNQVWVLLAIAASAFVVVMSRQVWRELRHRDVARTGVTAVDFAQLGLVVATAVALASLAYPILATGPRLAQRFTPGTPSGTLDALAWMDEGRVPSFGPEGRSELSFAGDAEAIAWLFANVPGSPVIAEAAIGPYRCNGSRISAATGLPTIIGWARHEEQQRLPETLPARVADVRDLYTSTDPVAKESILRRYNVAYVVVGELERRYPVPDNECTPTGSVAGIAAFDELIGTTLEVAFVAGTTTVYRVLPLAPT